MHNIWREKLLRRWPSTGNPGGAGGGDATPGRADGYPPRRLRRSHRAFTLIEVMCATTLVTVGLMATFYLMGLSTSVGTDSKNLAQAYQAAQQEIEIIRNIPYSTFQSQTLPATASGTLESRFRKADWTQDSSRPNDAGYPGSVPCLANLTNGTGGLIVTNDPISGDQLKHVTVVVRWTDKSNASRSITVGTMIAQGGMDPR